MGTRSFTYSSTQAIKPCRPRLTRPSAFGWASVQSVYLKPPPKRFLNGAQNRVASSMDQEVSSASFLDNVKAEQKLESTRIDSKTRESVISAIQSLKNRVTVGDVAGLAGVSLRKAEEALKALAADSSGTLEVSHGCTCGLELFIEVKVPCSIVCVLFILLGLGFRAQSIVRRAKWLEDGNGLNLTNTCVSV